MPTYGKTDEFIRDYAKLSQDEKREFKRAVEKFVEDLKGDGNFRVGLRVKKYQKRPGLFEMTWAPDGRALFAYGPERRIGEPHVVWHAIGSHDIF
jgi:hypothetical protein